MTVLGFKRRIEGKVGCPSSRHRLIYRGRLLTDDGETLASCGVLDGHTIHFVRGGPPATAVSLPPPPPADAFAPPDAMRSMMDSPMLQSMMQSPELMRSLVESNPQLRALADANPELRHALSDPALMRQAMQSARDPYGIVAASLLF
jgi:ubiquilin